MVREEREKADHLLLLDAGDALFSDHYLAQMSEGAIVVESMNLMGYDAMTLGERDLALDPNVLHERIAQADFAVVSANVFLDGAYVADPYVISNMAGHRVAIVGLTGALPGQPPVYTVEDPVETARSVVAEIAGQVDVIVALVHVGLEQERLLSSIPEIDVIAGGSSLPRTGAALWDGPGSQLILPSEQPSRGHAGRVLGMAELKFDSEGVLMKQSAGLVMLDPEIADDPEQTALLRRYVEKYTPKK
jgi:2',3'-cyclic-nucleotide 2'-phosphodiesterase (5'-nucleotidase family)